MSDEGPIQGIFPDMPETEYRQSPAVNQSALKPLLDKSPAHARWQADHQKPSTPAMEDGSILDQRILTPDRESPCVVMPDELAQMNGNKKEVQTWKKEQRALGKITIKQYDSDNLDRCVDSVWSHSEARKLLANSQKQVAGFACDLESGLWIKGLVDVLPDGPAIVDCKKSVSAKPEDFIKQAINLRYHLQAAYYLRIWNLNGYVKTDWQWIVYEAEAPYAVSVINCPPSLLAVGQADMNRALARWSNCEKRDNWPGYSSQAVEPTVPGWFLSQNSNIIGEVYA